MHRNYRLSLVGLLFVVGGCASQKAEPAIPAFVETKPQVLESFSTPLAPAWQWLDAEEGAWNLDGGRLNVRRYPGKGFYGTNMRIPVLYRSQVPVDDSLVVQTKVGFDVDKPYGQAGIVLFYDNDHYAKYVLEYWYNLGLHVIFLKEENGVPCHCKEQCERDVFIGKAAVELRIRYHGGKYVTEFRREGETAWTPHFVVDAIAGRGPINVGLFSQGDSGSSHWAWFDDFQLWSSRR